MVPNYTIVFCPYRREAFARFFGEKPSFIRQSLFFGWDGSHSVVTVITASPSCQNLESVTVESSWEKAAKTSVFVGPVLTIDVLGAS
ncbi:hypothetical protein CPB86DRAFT_877846, partial [Serendipita vermifera]